LGEDTKGEDTQSVNLKGNSYIANVCPEKNNYLKHYRLEIIHETS